MFAAGAVVAIRESPRSRWPSLSGSGASGCSFASPASSSGQAAACYVDPSDLGLPFEDVYPQLPNGVRVHGWWLPCADTEKVIVCFPGSIGNISHELTTASFLRGLGANVLIVDYPGFGRSEGRPSERGCYLDGVRRAGVTQSGRGDAARDRPSCLADRSVRRSRRGWRRGIPAPAWSCTAPSPRCRISRAQTYPFFPVRYFCYIRFDTLKQIRACGCPVVVMHAPSDSVIPVRHGERILQEAPEPNRFVPLRGNHYGSEWQDTPSFAPI